MKTIEIIINPIGETRIETKGFVGSECQKASRFIEQTLGRYSYEQLKPEFFQNQPAQQTNRLTI